MRIKRKTGLKGIHKQLEVKILTHSEKKEVKEFLEGVPIITVPAGTINGINNKTAKKAAIKWAKEYGNRRIKRSEGEIVFDKACVKKDFSHNINQNKLDSLPAVPDVLEKGRTLEISNDLDGKPIKNILIAAPIRIGQKPEIVIARARQHKGDDSRFYFHDAYNLEQIQKMSDDIKSGGSDKSVGLSRGIAHIKNVLHDIFSVNM